MQVRSTRWSEGPTPALERKRRMRIDLCETAPGPGSLLRAFGASGPKAYQVMELERRVEERHKHVECFAWLGWKTWRGFSMNDALLIDLSRGGARIFLNTPPPPGRAVWLFLQTPTEKAIVKARLLDPQLTAQGQCTARLVFHAPCPYALFEAAVCGLAAIDPKARLAPAPHAATKAPTRAASRTSSRTVFLD